MSVQFKPPLTQTQERYEVESAFAKLRDKYTVKRVKKPLWSDEIAAHAKRIGGGK